MVKNFAFLKILNLALFALGFFTDLEILDVFQSTGLFLNRKKERKFGFFLSES